MTNKNKLDPSGAIAMAIDFIYNKAMANIIRPNLIRTVPAKYFIPIILFWLVIFDFLLSASFPYPLLRTALNNRFLAPSILFLAGFLLVCAFSALCFSQDEPRPGRALIVLSPIIFLSFWPAAESGIPAYLPALIVIATQMILYRILFSREKPALDIKSGKEKTALSVLIVLYLAVFAYLSISKLNALAFFNPKDFGLFNQTFWNTIHGRFFLNSTYGSHFACHNSPFYILLLPFYYLAPGIPTLLALKTALLALAAIPFYLIAKDTLKETSPLPLVIAFMFFPYVVGQNFTPPHESGYAPFFILFAYYFFSQKKFAPFLFFLLIAVSIKEPMALLAVAFGFYGFLKKRPSAWVILPMLIGAAWFILSLALINHFQNIYHPHSDSAWFFVYLKKAFLAEGRNWPSGSIGYLLYNANLTHTWILKSAALLLVPLGIITPLLGWASLLGLPELTINLLSCNPRIFSPEWHYNIVLACFLLLGSMEGIKKISSYICGKKYLKTDKARLELVLSILIASATLMHSYTWIGLARYNKDPAYIKEVQRILGLVGARASVSVPLSLAPLVSAREEYSINGDGKTEDYLLSDGKIRVERGYSQIFRGETLILYKKDGI